MDYEQDEQEEQFEEQAADPQAEDMEIDEDDAPYLDLRDDRERQAYAMIKNRNFGHTKAFDPNLLEKTGLQEAGPEGRNSCSSILSLNHSNMRLEVRHGRAPAPPSGHGRPQGTGPPVLAPVVPRDIQLCPEALPL